MKVLFSSQKRPYLYVKLLLSLLIMSLIDASYATSYVINPSQTSVRFTIEHFKTSTITGGFYNVKGQLQYNLKVQIEAMGK